MLWEVERILSELKEKPQVLLMENVIQVHGEGNKEDFNKWQLKLEELGYEKIPEDYYFVVGDNRGDSKDSRSIGLIHKSRIKGKTSWIFFPFSRMGKVN